MRVLDNALCYLAQKGRRQRSELGLLAGPEDLVADLHYLIKEEVVEDAIAAQDQDVALVRRDAMHRAALLDDFQRNGLVEILIDPAVHAGQLQRCLHVEVNTLHLRVEDCLQFALPAVGPPKHQQLAVADGEHSDHWVQLAVDPGAVVQRGEQHSGGAETLGGLVCLLEQRDGPPVGVLWRNGHVWHELVHRQLFASLQELIGQEGWVHVEFLQL
mmetsp:Transcript_124704/g.347279  ORF Transcript_124704/g.347279 Transcript_124704/m.347279 type:complete len:215 (+) Transcript_124704:453-1097(+)